MIPRGIALSLLLLAIVAVLTVLAAAPRSAYARQTQEVLRISGCQEGAGEGDSSSSVAQWLIPLVIVVAVVAWRGFLLLGGRSSSARTAYGPAGGAICPKCGRSFPRSVWSPNLITGKLSRCPHCGGWSIVARADREALEAAEATHAEGSRPAAPTGATAEQLLQKRIEESRFEEGSGPRA